MDNQDSLETTLADLLSRTKEDASRLDVSPSLGTIQGSSVLIDSVQLTIPLSDVGILMHWQYTYTQSPSFEKPNYKNGDRVLLVPTTDSHYVIVGKVG